ncbi:MAG TPA: ABC-2 family transporter protein [Polyangiaceae bacterium]|jgi:ABC-2 type transport system permease protein|nr:ABC-2 family transporter protein [Polyangiaceae bacterium]
MKLFKLLGLFWSTSLAAEMEYRSNFVMATLSTLFGLGATLFALSLFYRRGADLGGWSWLEALLVLGMFTLLHGLSRTLFEPNLSRIVEHVRTGTLDFVLLKPIDSQLWLSTRRLSPWGVPDIVLGVGLIAYAATTLGLEPLSFLVALVPVASSLTILYSIWFTVAATTIWYVKIYNITDVLQAWLDAGRYPIESFPPGVFRFIFTFVVPVAFLTTVPARAMLGHFEVRWLLYAVLLAAGLFVFSRVFWRFALRFYTSASS